MDFAHENSLPIAVKTTAHQVVNPAEGALLITMGRLSDVTVDVERGPAAAAAGSTCCTSRPRWGSRRSPGRRPGSSRYTLGGLSPVLSRAHGYAADHVRSIEIVTVDGEFRVASAESEPDLF